MSKSNKKDTYEPVYREERRSKHNERKPRKHKNKLRELASGKINLDELEEIDF